jgi:hypothetical protein
MLLLLCFMSSLLVMMMMMGILLIVTNCLFVLMLFLFRTIPNRDGFVFGGGVRWVCH